MIPSNAEFILTELRNVREESNLTIADLSRKLGVGQNTLSYWERGLNQPNLANLVNWAETLGYELDLHPINKRRNHV